MDRVRKSSVWIAGVAVKLEKDLAAERRTRREAVRFDFNVFRRRAGDECELEALAVAGILGSRACS